MSIKKILVAAAACSLFSGIAAAQGAFDFRAIPGLPADPNVQVDLGPALLGFVAEAARQSDPGAADMIAGLRSISVRVYEELTDLAAVDAFVNDTSSSLEQSGWERVVFVQDGTDKVRIYARIDGNEMAGMTVMVLDSSDAVFINIDGRVNPQQLGRVAAAMGFDGVLGGMLGAVPPTAGGGRQGE